MGLCEKWKFPKNFGLVCGYHHRPLELAREIRTVPTVIAVADRLAASTGDGFRLDIKNLAIPAEYLDELKMTPETLKQIQDKLPEALQNVQAMLS